MIVALTRAGAWGLEETDDFRKFKVTVRAGSDVLPELRAPLAGTIDFDDPTTAWVAISALRRWSSDAAWQQGLAAMIEKARPHGWIDPAGQRVRAHVEWLD